MTAVVRDAMTQDPVCVSPATPISQAASTMRAEDVGSLPVVDGDRLVGVVTDRDIVTRAVAEGMGISDSRVVSSPTFVLIQEYQARLPIFHFDAYRLKGPAEFFDLGAHEYFQGTGVCLVEWADRVGTCLPPEYLRITITPTGETARSFELAGNGARYKSLVQELDG